MEIWKTVNETNGLIEVSDLGRVRSLLRGTPTILKTQTDTKGYLRVSVTINKVKRTYKLHRLVAMTFLENPNQLPQVNHKDGNKLNNALCNLEWISNKDNAHHAIANGLWDSVRDGAMRENESRKKPIIACRVDGDFCTRYYCSISDAERDIGSRHITDVLKGKRNHVKGWTFEYAQGR